MQITLSQSASWHIEGLQSINIFTSEWINECLVYTWFYQTSLTSPALLLYDPFSSFVVIILSKPSHFFLFCYDWQVSFGEIINRVSKHCDNDSKCFKKCRWIPKILSWCFLLILVVMIVALQLLKRKKNCRKNKIVHNYDKVDVRWRHLMTSRGFSIKTNIKRLIILTFDRYTNIFKHHGDETCHQITRCHISNIPSWYLSTHQRFNNTNLVLICCFPINKSIGRLVFVSIHLQMCVSPIHRDDAWEFTEWYHVPLFPNETRATMGEGGGSPPPPLRGSPAAYSCLMATSCHKASQPAATQERQMLSLHNDL